MKTVKKTNEYEVLKKRSGRFAVRGADRKWVNGDDKLKILIAEGLVEAPRAKPEAEADGDAAAAPE